MFFEILTLFPEAVEGYLKASILGKAEQAGLVGFGVINIRDFTHDRHHTADDRPFGGGSGMVMKPEPLAAAIEAAGPGRVIMTSPRGKPFCQAEAARLSGFDKLILVCGRYEGVDQRVIDQLVDEEISIGDYVLTGGELAALTVTDAVARLIPGVLGDEGSAEEESFSDGLLEYPHYTRPREFRGLDVPEVLLSGDHARIARWRRREALRITLERRPELLDRAELSPLDRELLAELAAEDDGRD